MNTLQKYADQIGATLSKYSGVTHTLLALWNAFMVSWATKIAVPVNLFGALQFTINATTVVDKVQAILHAPTWTLAAATFILNAFVAYKSFKASQNKPSSGSGTTAGPSSLATGAAVAVIALFFVAMLSCTGCTNWERDTFQTLSASKAVIDQAQADYEARTIPRTTCAFTVINDAKAAQTTAVDAMVAYEGVKAAKGDVNAAEGAVVADLVVLPADIVAVKALYSKPACEVK